MVSWFVGLLAAFLENQVPKVQGHKSRKRNGQGTNICCWCDLTWTFGEVMQAEGFMFVILKLVHSDQKWVKMVPWISTGAVTFVFVFESICMGGGVKVGNEQLPAVKPCKNHHFKRAMLVLGRVFATNPTGIFGNNEIPGLETKAVWNNTGSSLCLLFL